MVVAAAGIAGHAVHWGAFAVAGGSVDFVVVVVVVVASVHAVMFERMSE